MTSAHKSDRAPRKRTVTGAPVKQPPAAASQPEDQAPLAASRPPSGGAARSTPKLLLKAKTEGPLTPARPAKAAGSPKTAAPAKTEGPPKPAVSARIATKAKPAAKEKAVGKSERAAAAKSEGKSEPATKEKAVGKSEPAVATKPKGPSAPAVSEKTVGPSKPAAPERDAGLLTPAAKALPAEGATLAAGAVPVTPVTGSRSRRGLGSLGMQAFNRATPALQLLPRPQHPNPPALTAGAGDPSSDAASLIAQARLQAGGGAKSQARHKDPVAFLRDELLALLALIEEPPEPRPEPPGS